MSDKQAFLLPSLQGWYGATEVGSKVEVVDGSRPRLLEKKPLLVGEWLSGEPYGPLSARPAWVLCAILGITYETFLCLFNRVNVLKHWKGEKLPRVSTLRVLVSDLKLVGEPVILLGRRVCQAVMKFIPDNYDWGTLSLENNNRHVPTVAIPHPAKLKQASERRQVRETLERALLYHGKLFKVGDYPNGNGSMIMINGTVWGDAAKRLKHRSTKKPEAHYDVGIGDNALRKD